MNPTEKKIKDWNAKLRAARLAQCSSCGTEPQRLEEGHTVRCAPETPTHYAEVRCAWCGQHHGWVERPPAEHEAAWRRYEEAWAKIAATFDAQGVLL